MSSSRTDGHTHYVSRSSGLRLCGRNRRLPRPLSWTSLPYVMATIDVCTLRRHTSCACGSLANSKCTNGSAGLIARTNSFRALRLATNWQREQRRIGNPS
jgi:hypothetical protein